VNTGSESRASWARHGMQNRQLASVSIDFLCMCAQEMHISSLPATAPCTYRCCRKANRHTSPTQRELRVTGVRADAECVVLQRWCWRATSGCSMRHAHAVQLQCYTSCICTQPRKVDYLHDILLWLSLRADAPLDSERSCDDLARVKLAASHCIWYKEYSAERPNPCGHGDWCPSRSRHGRTDPADSPCRC